VSTLEILAAPGALPGLVHCRAGKDRTGMVIAMALSAVGVPDDTLAEDYGLTETTYTDEIRATYAAEAVTMGVRTSRVGALMGSPPVALRTALGVLRARHGSVRQYLLDQGLAPESLEALRKALVQPAA
jgi:protein-tyrosine phosphatase